MLCKKSVRMTKKHQTFLMKIVANARVHELRHLQQLQQLRFSEKQRLTCEWYFNAFLLCV